MTHYIPANNKDEQEIFDALEIKTFEDLVSIIPKHLRIKDGLLGLEQGISEYDLDLYVKSLSNSKESNNNLLCFSGGGVYDHFVPKVVDFIASRSEFNTA